MVEKKTHTKKLTVLHDEPMSASLNEGLATVEEVLKPVVDVVVKQPVVSGLDYIRIYSPLPAGFWRIKRHFTKEPVDILLSSLTAEEIASLSATDARYLVVELITK